MIHNPLQFSQFGPVSDLRLVDLPDPQPDEHTAVVKVAAASIDTRTGTSAGSTDCWYAGSCAENASQQGSDTTRARTPAATSLS